MTPTLYTAKRDLRQNRNILIKQTICQIKNLIARSKPFPFNDFKQMRIAISNNVFH